MSVTTPSDAPLEQAPELPKVRPRSVLRDARAELRATTGRYRHLLRYLVSSSLRTENSNTVLGFLWWILDPLFLMATYVLLVGVILGRGGPDFPIFVLTAIIAWQLFSKSTRTAVTTTIRQERSMRQVAYPKTILPLSAVVGESIHFAVAFGILLLIAIPFDIYPSVYALLAIPIALVQLMFTLGVAYFLSAFNVFFRDTNKFISYGFRAWFYLSPALYPLSAVPEQFRSVYELNPFATLMTAYRDVVMAHTFPDFAALGIVAGASALVLIGGYLFFIRLQPWFAKLV